MSDLLIFVAIGLAFLVLLLLWVQRSAEAVADRREFGEAQEALTTLHLELPARALADRIFAAQDWDFVSSQAPPRIQRIFLQERRAVALSWLRETRVRIRRLMDFHVRAVRRNIALRPAVEIKLAISYVLFLLICKILLGLIWLRGPFGARRMVGYAVDAADNLSFMFGGVLASLDPARLDRVAADWKRRSARS